MSKQWTLERLEKYLLNLPEVRRQRVLLDELQKEIDRVCEVAEVPEHQLEDLKHCMRHFALYSELPYTGIPSTWATSIFQSTARKRLAFKYMKENYFESFHTAYWDTTMYTPKIPRRGAIPRLATQVIGIKNTRFTINAEYHAIKRWLRRLDQLPAHHFSDGYEVLSRRTTPNFY